MTDNLLASKKLCGWKSETHYCIRPFPHEGMPHVKAKIPEAKP